MAAPLNKKLGLSEEAFCRELLDLWNKGLSTEDVAAHFDCFPSSLYRWFKKAGIKSSSGPRRKRFCGKGHEFTPSNTRVDKNGYRSCIQCENLRSQKRKDKMRENSRVRRQNPELRQRDLEQMRKTARKRRLKQYGITEMDFSFLEKIQGNACAICRRPFDPNNLFTTCHIDHDHKTEKVRGLLCGECNLGLGKFKDDHQLLSRAVDYLKGKRALIFGVGGQDGHYLSHFLENKGYEVHGVVRRTSQENPMVRLLPSSVILHSGDITDFSSVLSVMQTVRPYEVYNLAAQSHVGISFKEPLHTTRTNYLGVVNILEAARLVNSHQIRVYQASTSEMFGGVSKDPCNENSPLYPKSPYGVAKVAAHHFVINSREAHDSFACSGILFNHESEHRPDNFVTRKISSTVAKIKIGQEDKLYLGNLDAKRDWGYAGDYVEAMWLMLQMPEPDDFVIGTGETHSVREFCQVAFEYAGLGDYRQYVEVDPRFFRPAEVDVLLADYSKAKRVLGWEPKVSFEQLVEKMVDYDVKLLGNS